MGGSRPGCGSQTLAPNLRQFQIINQIQPSSKHFQPTPNGVQQPLACPAKGKGGEVCLHANVPGLVTISRSSEPAVADRRGWVTPDALTAGGGDASHVLHVLDERSCIYMNMHGADRRFCSPNARCAAMPNIMAPRALDFASRGTQTGCIFRAWGCDI